MPAAPAKLSHTIWLPVQMWNQDSPSGDMTLYPPTHAVRERNAHARTGSYDPGMWRVSARRNPGRDEQMGDRPNVEDAASETEGLFAEHMFRVAGTLAAITIVAAAIALSNIGSGMPLDAHEIYVARTAEEMIDRGEWLVPHFNDAPRLNKPPLSYWLAIAADRLIVHDREVSEFEARLPSAIGGVALVLMTVLFGLIAFDRRVAVLAGLIAATTSGYLAYTHSARPEMVYAALCTAGLLGLFLAERWYAERSTGRSRLAAWFAWGAFGLAVLSKGPQLPLIILAGWYIGAAAGSGFKAALRATRIRSGLPLALLLSSWWFIFIWLTVPGAKEIWHGETLNRYVAGDDPWWGFLDPYYLYQTAGLVIPWVVVFPLAMVARWNSGLKHNPAAVRLWWLVVVAMVMLSCSFGRRSYYMLPVLPPLILLMSASVVQLCSGLSARCQQRGWPALLALHVGGITTALLWLVADRADRNAQLLATAAIVSLAAVTIAMLAWPVSRKRIGAVGSTVAVCCFTVLAFTTAQQTGVLHSNKRFERAAFSRQVKATISRTSSVVGWWDDWPEEQYALHRPIVDAREVSTVEDRLRERGESWLLVDTNDPPPALSSDTSIDVLIEHDYDGYEDRLQLWRLKMN
jgi:4-amino-4-deoxy-L-arabinose transferase-like glycosyltransferase